MRPNYVGPLDLGNFGILTQPCGGCRLDRYVHNFLVLGRFDASGIAEL